MAKVLVERPRRNGGYKHPKGEGRKNQNIEDMPNKESMRKKWLAGGVGKELNENLNPLSHFLDSRVGRKWNDVYSEIRERVNANSAVQYHIIQHLDDMVEKHARFEGGKVYHPINMFYSRNLELYHNQLYVDQNGYLRKYHNPPEKKKKPPVTRFKKDGLDYEKINGIWYKAEWAERQVWIPPRPHYMESLRPGKYPPFKGYYRTESYIKSKKQLNTKELRRLGLTNGTDKQ